LDEKVEKALSDLGEAVELLNSAVAGRLDGSHASPSNDEQLNRMRTDRVKLAESLDEAEARSGRLSDANSEVSARLVAAMETIRSVLEHSEH